MQELVKNGILMPAVVISASHDEKELELTLNAINKVLKIYSEALSVGVDKFIDLERVVKPVFRRYN